MVSLIYTPEAQGPEGGLRAYISGKSPSPHGIIIMQYFISISMASLYLQWY